MLKELIKTVVVGPDSWKSFSFFNTNAYPDYLKIYAQTCGDKLALISYSCVQYFLYIFHYYYILNFMVNTKNLIMNFKILYLYGL